MKLFSTHARWLVGNVDHALVLGLAGGRVSYLPAATCLYSLRLFLLIARIEILWTTGEQP